MTLQARHYCDDCTHRITTPCGDCHCDGHEAWCRICTPEEPPVKPEVNADIFDALIDGIFKYTAHLKCCGRHSTSRAPQDCTCGLDSLKLAAQVMGTLLRKESER